MGSDPHFSDPLGHLNVSAQEWLEAVRIVDGFGLPLVACGGGGYNIAWEVVTGNGTLSAARTVTGSDGQTSVSVTPTVGGQSAVTATIAEDLQGLYQVTFVMEGTL